MNGRLRNIIFLSILMFVTTILLVGITCSREYSEIGKNILIGIISSLLLLLLIEVRNLILDNYNAGHLRGTYKRTNGYNINKTKESDTIYDEVDYSKVPSEINLIYKGDREYECEISYPEGIVKANFYLDSINNTIGTGKYQYIKKHSATATMPDLGTYSLHVDLNNNKKIYIFHKNLIPSGLAEGYEIWIKQ